MIEVVTTKKDSVLASALSHVRNVIAKNQNVGLAGVVVYNDCKGYYVNWSTADKTAYYQSLEDLIDALPACKFYQI